MIISPTDKYIVFIVTRFQTVPTFLNSLQYDEIALQIHMIFTGQESLF